MIARFFFAHKICTTFQETHRSQLTPALGAKAATPETRARERKSFMVMRLLVFVDELLQRKIMRAECGGNVGALTSKDIMLCKLMEKKGYLSIKEFKFLISHGVFPG